jgi:hypothetical protein
MKLIVSIFAVLQLPEGIIITFFRHRSSQSKTLMNIIGYGKPITRIGTATWVPNNIFIQCCICQAILK